MMMVSAPITHSSWISGFNIRSWPSQPQEALRLWYRCILLIQYAHPFCPSCTGWCLGGSIELDIHHRHGRNHLDLGQVIEHFEQGLARVDKPMPSEFTGFVGTLCIAVMLAYYRKELKLSGSFFFFRVAACDTFEKSANQHKGHE
jgi:hypothetical protein